MKGKEKKMMTTTQEQQQIPRLEGETRIEEEHVTTGWVLVVYGIPDKLKYYQTKLRWICKEHGLWSIDSGGSVYLGPRVIELDNGVQRVIEALRKEVGSTAKLVHFIVGDYEKETASFFYDRVTGQIFEDVELIESSIGELEKAVAGEIVLKDKKGKERNLVTLGASRIANAFRLLDAMDSAALRFEQAANPRLAEKIRIRVAQVRAWVQQIQRGFERFRDAQKRKKNADGGGQAVTV